MNRADIGNRVAWLMLGFLVFSFIVAGRLGWLQLVQSRQLAGRAVNMHTRTVFFDYGHGSEGRGAILDRNLNPFTGAGKRPGLAVFVNIGSQEPDLDYWLGQLGQLTGLTRNEIVVRSNLRLPLLLARPLDSDAQLPHWIKPVFINCDDDGEFQRNMYGDLACHVLGIVTSPYPDDEDPAGSRVGRLGIEKAYDDFLRTTRPGISAFVDGANRLIPGLGYRVTGDPSQMPAVALTLDIGMQILVEDILDSYIARGLIPASGAVVVMDPHTGHILAMASRPVIDEVTNHHNRATSKSNAVAMVPAASLVKLVTAAAALESDPGLLDFTAVCTGQFQLGNTTFYCRTGPHGQQDLGTALANSCNQYFAALAQQVGRRQLLELATKMGLGRAPDLGLPAGEVSAGRLPTLDDLATAAGLANHFAMGSNRLEVTPVQVATMVSVLANGGYRIEPRLVLGTTTLGADQPPRPPVERERVLSTSVCNMVTGMMRRAVSEGSARFFDKGRYPAAARGLAAKTGTSDSVPPHGYQILWNAGIYPWRSPRYVIVYMAEVPKGARTAREQLMAEIVQKLAERE